MDPFTVTAEYVYYHSHMHDGQPPLWLDITFIVTMVIIHITFAFKFTNFSLAYLNAKCEEKKSEKKWTASKLYLHTIQSTNFDDTEIDFERFLSTSLWTKFTIIRYLVRILLFVSCCIILLLYIALQLNILYEYLFACFVDVTHGSWLGLICFPAFISINIGVCHYLFYGIMSIWSINLDVIADKIAYEHQPFTRGPSTHDESRRPNTRAAEHETPEAVLYKQFTSHKQTKSIWSSYQDTMVSFTSPYWMAMHWRLSIVLCCVLASIFALPSIYNEFETGHSIILFGFQVFLRYASIAMIVWLAGYLIACIIIGLYARITTLVIDPGNSENESNSKKESRCRHIVNGMIRFLCLSDSFGFKDSHKTWTNCKCIQLTMILLSGLILIAVWMVYYNALLWFIGVMHILYYISNILATTKPHGVYYLWQCDDIQLQLFMAIDSDEMNDEDELYGINRQTSHAVAMNYLSQQQLKLIMRDKDDEHALNTTEQLLIGGQQDDMKMRGDDEEAYIEEDDEQLRSQLYETDSEEEVFNDHEEETQAAKDEKVFSMFLTLYAHITNERKVLYQERQAMSGCDLCMGCVCCCNKCGLPRPMNFILMYNYLYSIFSYYKGYWLLILPYKYNMRPLSVLCNGPSWTERLVTYNYRGTDYATTCSKVCRLCCNGLLTMCCCLLFILGFMLLLCVSTDTIGTHYMNHMMEHDMDHQEMISHGFHARHWNESVVPNIASESYPVCGLKWNANLSIFDLTAIAHMTYDIGVRESKYNTSIQREICVYFDEKWTVNCSWKVMYSTMDEPVFVHLRNVLNKTDVIAIRGPQSRTEMLRYSGLFTQVALVEMASWVIPITSILPTSFVIRIVSFMSHFEGMIDVELRERYDEPVFKYAQQLLMDTEYKMESMYFVGHSFGGSIAQIVAAQMSHLCHNDNEWIDTNFTDDLDIKSFAISSPGMILSSRKFWVNRHDLFVTSTVLRPQYGVISNIDIAGGLVQDMECHDMYSCHHTGGAMFNLMAHCDVYQSQNPQLIQNSCYGSSANSFILHLNESTKPPTLNPTTEPTLNPTVIPTVDPTSGPTSPPTRK